MDRPNLLFIFTDEQRADTMSAYGNTQIDMPNINRLSSQCTVFDQAYVTQAVCTPSRSSILTGLYPHANGCTENNVDLSADTPCFPEMIARGTYATAYYGKWHLGDEIFCQHGFEEWISIEDNYAQFYGPGRDRSTRSTYHHFLVENGFSPARGTTFGRGETARFPEAFGKPAYLAQEASRFIRENRNRPFALFVNFLEPHMPFFGPRDDQYDPRRVELPDNFDAFPTQDQPLKTRLFQKVYEQRGHSGLPLKSQADWRRMIANYWGLCSLVDTHVGTILDTLDDCGLADNTIVVYTSDHGDMMGSHRLLAKCVQYQEAVRVPLLIRLPGQTKPHHITHPVSQIDLVPTLLDLMGQPIPDHLQGHSLEPLCRGDTSIDPGDILIEWNGSNNGLGDRLNTVSIPGEMNDLASKEDIVAATRDPVRTIITHSGWKLNYSPLGEHELYHLGRDPGERRNLARDRTFHPLMNELTIRICSWQARTGDQVPIDPLDFDF